ncbi:Glycoside hydrolase, family 17 [Corchorus capsularis]|uniref:glucan endo-1,3-beta-D-glucosidase n=1 Tax=Corchorus capsularis TaxID=210143 RepID=A0A1R3IYF8_COCAP|nr:Glycoside hydrolase, family 17 [Corchorus capsularis]
MHRHDKYGDTDDSDTDQLRTTSASNLKIQQAESQSFIGINYGQVADNLPSPAATAKLLQSTAIQKVRLYGSDPAIIKALANTGIGIVIGTANGDIPALASDPNFAKNWVNANVVAYYPSSKIILINVGNESEPPSAGLFDPSFADVLKGLLAFNNATGSPFAVNPYPYFAYRSDPRPETLAFCLFQPNSGRFDANTKINYMNMFDAQVDSVRSALNAMGFKNVEIVVAETGWPYKGDSDEVGPSIENAKAYNGNLIAHLRSMAGTPLMPGKSVDTYLFAIYDEDLKPGPSSERSFGIFKSDLTMTYDIGLSKSSQTPSVTPAMPKTPATPSAQPKKAAWCVPKAGVSDAQLQASLDYACGQGIDCSPIQPGGACFEPNTLASHAAYAMNLFYQSSDRSALDCDFSQTAMLSSNNPSSKPSVPIPSPTISTSHGREALLKVIRSWASKKFMTGCVILLPMAITFYVTWGFVHFVDGFFSPIYDQLGINVFGLGFATSITFIFLVGVFMSSWWGASVLTLGEWFIKKMPLVSYIYAASKQISTAISPDQNSNAFKEVAIVRHPRMGQYMFGFITSTVVLQKGVGEEELCCVYIPTNHLYLGDIFLFSSRDILRPNLSVREGIEIVISGGMSVPKVLTTVDAPGLPASRIVNFEASV